MQNDIVRTYSFPIDPLPKPRMTQRDKWYKRSVTTAYWTYVKALQQLCLWNRYKITEKLDIVFYIPMPKSWSDKKRQQMTGTKHQQKPDADNLMKAFKDALAVEDSFIWDERARKVWAEKGSLLVIEHVPTDEADQLADLQNVSAVPYRKNPIAYY